MGGNPGPLGIFDSGVGGFSVLSVIRTALPDESVIYVADQRYAPYGERTLDEVADRAVQIAGQLIEAGTKLIVVACNSASAAALLTLRRRYPGTPFVGMEPAVKPAALHSASGVIGVLATAATFQGELFASVVDRHAGDVTVLPIVGAGLAALVEDGAEAGPEAKTLLDHYLAPAMDRGMDTLVLGCTHYTFLRETIATITGDRVTVLDPAPAIARQVTRLLEANGLRAAAGSAPYLTLATTGAPAELAGHVTTRLGIDPPIVNRW